jgi:hypothetical protein
LDLHRHLGGLLASGDGADVAFRVAGETFRAHRCVLAVRSPVFKAELLGTMREGDRDQARPWARARCAMVQCLHLPRASKLGLVFNIYFSFFVFILLQPCKF